MAGPVTPRAAGQWRRVYGTRTRHFWAIGSGAYQVEALCGGSAANDSDMHGDEPDRRKCRHCERILAEAGDS